MEIKPRAGQCAQSPAHKKSFSEIKPAISRGLRETGLVDGGCDIRQPRLIQEGFSQKQKWWRKSLDSNGTDHHSCVAGEVKQARDFSQSGFEKVSHFWMAKSLIGLMSIRARTPSSRHFQIGSISGYPRLKATPFNAQSFFEGSRKIRACPSHQTKPNSTSSGQVEGLSLALTLCSCGFPELLAASISSSVRKCKTLSKTREQTIPMTATPPQSHFTIESRRSSFF